MVPDEHAAPRVGASACLLGDRVRWDGADRLEPWLRDVLGREVELVRVCPEVEVGMGVPREPVDLVRLGAGVRMLARSGHDWTEAMRAHAARRIAALPPLHGYVWKARSPSCGLGSTPLVSPGPGHERPWPGPGANALCAYGSCVGAAFRPLRRPRGEPLRTDGLFAAALVAARPFTPCVEETDLVAPAGRAHFVERLFAAARLDVLLAGRATAGRLVAFHAVHKYQLLAHAPARYRSLGRLVAGAAARPAQAREAYAAGFTAALAVPASTGTLVDALAHALGHLKRVATAPERASAAAAIAGFGRGEAPLAEPLSVLRHLVRVHGEPYLAGQTLLFPGPREWSLRHGP